MGRLLLVALVMVALLGCGRYETHTDPWVEWRSADSLQQSQRALELGFRDLYVRCKAERGFKPHIHIYGKPTVQILERRSSAGWPPGTGGTRTVSVNVSEYVYPDDYWNGIKPRDEFCPGFEFDWKLYYVNVD